MSDLEEAEVTYAKAEAEVAMWGGLTGDFAESQAKMWRKVMQANAWCLPGA